MRASWKLARALCCGALVAGLAAGCKRDPAIEERRLYVYSPNSCPVEQSEAFSVIYGDGDFEGESAVASLYLREVDKPLTELPANTRSVIVDVSNALRSKDWRGTAEVPPVPAHAQRGAARRRHAGRFRPAHHDRGREHRREGPAYVRR